MSCKDAPESLGVQYPFQAVAADFLELFDQYAFENVSESAIARDGSSCKAKTGKRKRLGR